MFYRFIVVGRKFDRYFVVCRKSSALGLDQPGSASTTPAPEPKKSSDAAVLQMEPATTSMPEKSLAPSTTEGDDADARPGMEEGPRMVEPALEIPLGEPIVRPPPTGSFLLEAHLILAGEVIGTPPQQPTAGDATAAGTFRYQVLITPPKSKYAIPTELINNPMLTPVVLKQFLDTHKELYNFSKVCAFLYCNLNC